MATPVDNFPKNSKDPKPGGWFQPYADGQIWKLTRGIDFTNEISTRRNYATTWAKYHGLSAKTRMDGECLYVQFLKKVAP